MKKKISLKDIANEVGVSVATVSYVLSEKKRNKVSKEVAAKILKVAKELNYKPNQAAISLKSGKSMTIGLIVADISNPFFANIARFIEDEAARANYTLIISSSDEQAKKSLQQIQFLVSRQVDGFILVPTEGSEDQISYIKEQDIPFVLIDRSLPKIQTNSVTINNHDAAFQAVSRLVSTGNTKIAIFAYSNSLSHMKGRVNGYIDAMGQAQLPISKDWIKEIEFSRTQEAVKEGVCELLQRPDPVTAIFFATNTLAIHGIRQIVELGLKVPTDVCVVSFDQSEAFDFFYSPITYVWQPRAEMAKAAVKTLVEQMNDPMEKNKQICMKAKLVVRQSCGHD